MLHVAGSLCFNPRSARVSGATILASLYRLAVVFQSALRSGERSDPAQSPLSLSLSCFNPRSARVSGATLGDGRLAAVIAVSIRAPLG